MPRMSLDIEAIKERFGKIRKKKAITRMAITEREQEGLTRRAEIEQAGLLRLAELPQKPKPWFDRRHEELQQRAEAEAKLEETGLAEAETMKRLKLTNVAAERLQEIQFGKKSPAMVRALAEKTVAEKLSAVEEKQAREGREEEYSKGARGLIRKRGMGTFIQTEEGRIFQPDERVENLYYAYLAQGGKEPAEALELFESELNILEAEKVELKRLAKLTPEQKREEEEATLKARELEKRILIKEQFPSLAATMPKQPQKVLSEEEILDAKRKETGKRFTQRRRIGGLRTGILEDIRKPSKWFKSYIDLRQVARQRT